MTEETDEKASLPFENQARKLETTGARGVTHGQFFLASGAVLLLIVWAFALQLYDPSSSGSIQEEQSLKPNTPAQQQSGTDTEGLAKILPPQQLAWRDQALEILEELTPTLELLERKAILQWSPESYQELIEKISLGEEAYGAQRFRDARDHYWNALQQGETLKAQMPEVFATYAERSVRLIEGKQYAEALELLEVAGSIDPENEPVAAAINTAIQGEAVDQLLTKARFFLDEEQPAEALGSLKEALSLDPVRTDVKNMEKEATGLSRQLAFRGYMRDGHAELAKTQFSDAIAAFDKAVKLYPGNEEASSALQAAEKQKMDNELSKLREQASAAMQQEAWAAAEKLYQSALTIKADTAFAETGLQQAVYYGRKQVQIRDLLAEPDRLSDQTVARYASEVIADLEQKPGLPSALGAEADKLKSTLQAYRRLVSVTFQSDGRSVVSIIRGQSFRPFREKSVELRPGRYTVLARREGYRDKRISFQVPLDGQPVTVTIGVDEKF